MSPYYRFSHYEWMVFFLFQRNNWIAGLIRISLGWGKIYFTQYFHYIESNCFHFYVMENQSFFQSGEKYNERLKNKMKFEPFVKKENLKIKRIRNNGYWKAQSLYFLFWFAWKCRRMKKGETRNEKGQSSSAREIPV